jgi:hypothetical protein
MTCETCNATSGTLAGGAPYPACGGANDHYLGTRQKAAAEVLDYTIALVFDPCDTDTVASTAWSVTPVETNGLSVSATPVPPFVTLPNFATAWLAGGILGHEYAVVARTTTTLGRVIERTFGVVIVG